MQRMLAEDQSFCGSLYLSGFDVVITPCTDESKILSVTANTMSKYQWYYVDTFALYFV